MATKDDSDMVMAYGDNGLELTPRSETVEIQVVPLGPGNAVIPATVRWEAARRNGAGTPLRLIGISKPSKRKGNRYVWIRYECTPFERYRTKDGPVLGVESICNIRNETDARDPIFARFTENARNRILRAVGAA